MVTDMQLTYCFLFEKNIEYFEAFSQQVSEL